VSAQRLRLERRPLGPHLRRSSRLALALAVGATSASLATASASAHVHEHVGPFSLVIGWRNEPAFVGELNGVQVTIHDAADTPVLDLKQDDLKVVVSSGAQQSEELTFEPAFDAEEMEGSLGEYDASLLPTAVGEYTFHFTGAIRGQKVDLTVTSGEDTFDSIKGTGDLEFPVKLPTMSEVVTRLDRIDSRLTDALSRPTQASVDSAVGSARASAADARSAADRALLVGGGLGAAGLVVGLLGIGLALRASRRSRG
jgi:hypothetical protein